jgi:hypothetical protein
MDQRELPPLREPTRSQEVNAKKRRRLAPVGMTGWVGREKEKAGKAASSAM